MPVIPITLLATISDVPYLSLPAILSTSLSASNVFNSSLTLSDIESVPPTMIISVAPNLLISSATLESSLSVGLSRIGAFNSLAKTEAVIESGNRSLLTTITVLDLPKNFLDISIAVSILSLPAILPVSGLFPVPGLLGFEGLVGVAGVEGLEFGFFGSVPFVFSCASV